MASLLFETLRKQLTKDKFCSWSELDELEARQRKRELKKPRADSKDILGCRMALQEPSDGAASPPK